LICFTQYFPSVLIQTDGYVESRRNASLEDAGSGVGDSTGELPSEQIFQLTVQASFRGPTPSNQTEEAPGPSSGAEAFNQLVFDPSSEEAAEVFGAHGLMESHLGLSRGKKGKGSGERRKMSELPRHLAGQMGEANVLYASREYEDARKMLMEVLPPQILGYSSILSVTLKYGYLFSCIGGEAGP